MTHELISTQTGLILHRTDTLINITNKLLTQAGIKGISQMSDDELWAWWLGLDDEWRFLFLGQGLKLEFWSEDEYFFDKEYDYIAKFDWFKKERVFRYLSKLKDLKEMSICYNDIQNLSPISHLHN